MYGSILVTKLSLVASLSRILCCYSVCTSWRCKSCIEFTWTVGDCRSNDEGNFFYYLPSRKCKGSGYSFIKPTNCLLLGGKQTNFNEHLKQLNVKIVLSTFQWSIRLILSVTLVFEVCELGLGEGNLSLSPAGLDGKFSQAFGKHDAGEEVKKLKFNIWWMSIYIYI